MPAAPPLLSITTGWPSASCIFGCRLWATKSRLPPGGKGTTNLIGRFGYGCACTALHRQAASTSSSLFILSSLPRPTGDRRHPGRERWDCPRSRASLLLGGGPLALAAFLVPEAAFHLRAV